jgi:hypothetical protein
VGMLFCFAHRPHSRNPRHEVEFNTMEVQIPHRMTTPVNCAAAGGCCCCLFAPLLVTQQDHCCCCCVRVQC